MLIVHQWQVHPHESVQLCYRSLSTQMLTWEYARCADKFYNKRRYDCVLVNAPTEQFFARIQGLYSCLAFNKTWLLACVTRLKRIDNQRSQVIGFPHVREERSGIWIDVSWITRFVYEQPTFDRDDEFFINDVVDSDMFLRLLNR